MSQLFSEIQTIVVKVGTTLLSGPSGLDLGVIKISRYQFFCLKTLQVFNHALPSLLVRQPTKSCTDIVQCMFWIGRFSQHTCYGRMREYELE